ncbi:NAD-dependent epimerase/dehydratase [Beijerinckia indica subsp. indica ATCC 9039]|uniref:NAD-dependent epimerase/dehydratase n=2 Tax=Beijerinckia TaxID=532 RepID=B2IIG7_BEII9|nr:NAD-dependent epimerase/dehydratase [Beijerinckia indica subsp. indica ATCC 9039]
MRLLETNKDVQVVLFDCNPDMRRITGFNKGPSDPQDPKYDPKDRYNTVADRVTFVQGDLALLSHVLAVFDKHEPTSVFHLGALLSAGADANPTLGFDVDLLGTRHVFEAARIYCQHNKKPPVRVLFPSTIASFGLFPFTDPNDIHKLVVRPPKPEDKLVVPNEAIQLPTTMYGVSKVSVERLGEHYHAKGWIDFWAVRFPSVVGAARGPGGTTAYSTLMIQEPLMDKAYEVYVSSDTRLDIIYVKDAVDALIRLHDAKDLKLRRVYNIAGIRIGGEAPQASDIAAAVKLVKPNAAAITYKQNDQLTAIVHTFGILDAKATYDDLQWAGPTFDLKQTIIDCKSEIDQYPGRIKAIELY